MRPRSCCRSFRALGPQKHHGLITISGHSSHIVAYFPQGVLLNGVQFAQGKIKKEAVPDIVAKSVLRDSAYAVCWPWDLVLLLFSMRWSPSRRAREEGICPLAVLWYSFSHP